MSDKKYVRDVDSRNRSRAKYHTDKDCHAISGDCREINDHDKRLNLQPCSYCAGGLTAMDLIND